MTETTPWQKENIQNFWSNRNSSGHLVQIYENKRVFIDSLEGFAGTGILAGDSVVIVAKDSTLHELELRLRIHDFDIDKMIEANQYIPIDAEKALASFMRNGMPDLKCFTVFCNQLLSRAKSHSSHIRVFGEMVVILLEQGKKDAMIALEELWNKLCARERFCLFCAYPQSEVLLHSHECFDHICSSHTQMIGGWSRPSTEIYYKDLKPAKKSPLG